jgi:molecular chaperone DnaK (HSP70)
VSELVSHFFRNLHNQIKQQVGRVVRECILSIPFVGSVNEVVRQRLMESAQAGGIRVKAIVPDALATMLAFGNCKNIQ